jgi:hypothetical protein
MATEASDKPAEVDESEAARKSFLRRIPTPILVTLVGIVLSAWLLPAVTRQWDDRQKAHDVEAALVAQMTSDTARVLEEARATLYRESVPFLRAEPRRRHNLPTRLPAIETEWSVASLGIEAKLNAYFPASEQASLWRGYRELVAGLLQWVGRTGHWEFVNQPDPLLVQAAANIDVPTERPAWQDQTPFRALQPFVRDHNAVLSFERLAYQRQLDTKELDNAMVFAGAQLTDFRKLESVLLDAESTIALRVLAGHPRGYSTTFGDFLHDLKP